MFVNRCPCAVAQTVHNTMHCCRYVACTVPCTLSRAPRISQPHALSGHMKHCRDMGPCGLYCDRDFYVTTENIVKPVTTELFYYVLGALSHSLGTRLSRHLPQARPCRDTKTMSRHLTTKFYCDAKISITTEHPMR